MEVAFEMPPFIIKKGSTIDGVIKSIENRKEHVRDSLKESFEKVEEVLKFAKINRAKFCDCYKGSEGFMNITLKFENAQEMNNFISCCEEKDFLC